MRADTPTKEVKSYDNQNRVQLQTQKIISNNKKRQPLATSSCLT